MSQQASIGKPPERQKPPSTFQGGMRRIIYVEPEPEKPRFRVGGSWLTGREIAYISAHAPSGATGISKVARTPEGFDVSYGLSQPTQEVPLTKPSFEFKGEKVTGKELAWIGKQTPEGYEPASVKREGDVLNIVYQERQVPQPQGQPFMGLIGVEHGGLMDAPTSEELGLPNTQEILTQLVTGKTPERFAPGGEKYDPSGRAYAWTAMDVYNIASTGLLIATAAHSIISLPKNIALESGIASREALRQQLYQETPLEKAGIKASASAEFQTQTVQPLETAKFQPPEQWYRVTRGTPTTPMSKTLENAIYGPAKGGLSAEQILVPKSTWKAPYDLLQIRMLPKVYPETLPLILPVMLKPTQPTRLTPTTTTKAATLAGVKSAFGISQAQLSMQKQSLATLQTQGTQQIQALRQMQLQRQMQITRQHEMPYDFGLPKAMGKRSMKQFGLWGRYKRFYPVATAQEVLKMKRKFL